MNVLQWCLFFVGIVIVAIIIVFGSVILAYGLASMVGTKENVEKAFWKSKK